MERFIRDLHSYADVVKAKEEGLDIAIEHGYYDTDHYSEAEFWENYFALCQAPFTGEVGRRIAKALKPEEVTRE